VALIRKCTESAPKLLWNCPETAVHFLLTKEWLIWLLLLSNRFWVALIRKCTESAPKLLWNCSETALKLPRNCCSLFVDCNEFDSFDYYCYRIAALLWKCSESALKVLRKCSESAPISEYRICAYFLNTWKTIRYLFGVESVDRMVKRPLESVDSNIWFLIDRQHNTMAFNCLSSARKLLGKCWFTVAFHALSERWVNVYLFIDVIIYLFSYLFGSYLLYERREEFSSCSHRVFASLSRFLLISPFKSQPWIFKCAL